MLPRLRDTEVPSVVGKVSACCMRSRHTSGDQKRDAIWRREIRAGLGRIGARPARAAIAHGGGAERAVQKTTSPGQFRGSSVR